MGMRKFLLFFCSCILALENGIATGISENLIPCKDDWYLFGEKCYKVGGENEGVYFEKGSEQCSLEGGHLATITSDKMRDFIFTFLLLNVASDAWIGLNCLKKKGDFVWDDGSALGYTDWEPDRPIGPWDDCVRMRYWTDKPDIGRWDDYDCRSHIPYICQAKKDKKYRNPDPRFCSAGRGGGWKYLDSCYHIVTEKKSWRTAERHCQETFSGHLVTVIDFRAEYFLNYILSNYTEPFWYGIKIQEGAQQQWSSRWQVIFNRWESDEPFAEGTCCLRSSKHAWKRESCSKSHSFVCEVSTDKPPVEEYGHCPKSSKDWKKANGKLCYYVETETKRSWDGAKQECINRGGTLVNLHSKKELNDVYVQVRPLMRYLYAYIGLHRQSSNKRVFEWTDGSVARYQNWLPAEPNDENEECVTLELDVMRWNDLRCGVPHLYICSATKVLENGITMKLTQNLIPCRKGWYLFGEKCYKVEGESKGLNWEKASAQCSQNGGKLATINSERMQDFMFTFLLLNAASDVWIGLNDLALEGTYRWDDGSLLNYTYWEPGEPSGEKIPSRPEDCVIIRYWTHKTEIGMWNDYDCRSQIPYICQQMKDEKYRNPDPGFCSDERGGGWKYLNSCYHIVTEEKSWRDAEEYCQDNFEGHLVTVLDFSTEYFLNYILSNYNQPFWYGIKVGEEAQHYWSSGWQVIFSRLKENAPFLEGTCTMKSKNTWESVSCSQKNSFICETSSGEKHLKSDPRFCSRENGGDLKYSCYHIVNEKKSFADAEIYCQKHFNGHVVTILNFRMANFINGLLTNYTQPFWYSINIREETHHQLSFGWEVSVSSWKENVPFVGGTCAMRSSEFIWERVSCSQKKAFVCETSTDKPPVEEKWHCPESSKDWEKANGKLCYLIETKTDLTWYDANDDCKRKGGSLVNIHSKKELNDLYVHVKPLMRSEHMHIGLQRKLSNKNEFQWTDGSEASYQQWKPGEPNNINEECVNIHTNVMRWNDLSCLTKQHYICSATKIKNRVL